MDKKVKRLWVEALRSGEYKQCRGSLRKDTPRGVRVCVMGVLCNLHAQAHRGTKDVRLQTNPNNYFGSWSAPKLVLNWAGVTKSQCRDLISMNDFGEKSFSQIADYIEKNL